MEQTKRMASHVLLDDLSDPKYKGDSGRGAFWTELGVQHLDQEKMGQGKVFDIEWYIHWDTLEEYSNCKILRATTKDDRRKFVTLLKSHCDSSLLTEVLEKDESNVSVVKICPAFVLRYVMDSNAVDCATALFEGETDTYVLINTPVGYDKLYPLHVLAQKLSYEMISLFLELGARTNVRTRDPVNGDLLPLNLSLDALSRKVRRLGWTQQHSVFKLIFVLCLPEMNEALEVNRLLACNTEELEEILIYYAMKGEHIQMVALLMVAWEKVKPSSLLHSTSGSSLGGIMKVRQVIIEEINKEVKLMGKISYREFQHKSVAMMSALVLLEVFERVGDHMATFLETFQSQMPKEIVLGFVKLVLSWAGVVLEDEDVDLSDIDCSGSPAIKWEKETLEKQTTSISQLPDLCMPLHSMFCRPCLEKSITNNTPTPKSSMLASFPSVSVPGMQSYHTYGYLEDEFVPAIPSAMQHNVKRTMGVKEPFPHVLSSKKFVSIVLAVKRGLTRI